VWTDGLPMDKWIDCRVVKGIKVSIVLFSLLLTSACASNTGGEINSQTGMPEFLCPAFKDVFENANNEVWDLTEFKTSIESAQEAVFEVMSDVATISVVSEQPASDWLQDISENSKDFIDSFSTSSESTTEDLIQIYGRWKANYESINTYCP
jgi:hypothetical protein